MNTNGSSSDGAPDPCEPAEDELVRVLDDYLAAVDAGRVPDPEQLIAAHPRIADRLRDCLGVFGLAEHLAGDPESDRSREVVPVPDARIGDFRILRQIGRGGMGVVYEAEQLSLRRRVALKVMPFASALDPKQLQRFQLEAHAAACLHHTNIVPVHAVGVERGVPFYAMQLIDGQSLAEVIGDLRRIEGLAPHIGRLDLAVMSTSTLAAELLTDKSSSRVDDRHTDGPRVDLPSRPVPSPTTGVEPHGRVGPMTAPPSRSSTRTRDYVRNVARLGLQAAEALDHAHTRGILHRDIKPANLLLDPDGRLWVTDFGLAQVQGNPGLTLTGDLLGTLRYMSPEQALAKRVVIDGRTDVYSLGATLYELLTLRPAFDGKDRQEILRRIAEQDPVSLRRLNPAVPRDLETIVAKAMAKDPAARYASASALAEDLRSYLENRPIHARRPSLADLAAKWARRHRPLVASAVVTLLMAALMLAGSVGYTVRDRAARSAQARLRAAEALAGARAALRADDLAFAGQRVAEAAAYLGTEGEHLTGVAADIARVQREIEARRADEARFREFLKLAAETPGRMNPRHDANEARGGDRLAREALGLYGVLESDDWVSRLEASSLAGDEQERVRETAYELLVSLADCTVRQPGSSDDPDPVRSGLDLLRRARAFHEPTRAYYYVRSECHRRLGDETAAAEDAERFRTTPARTAWDHFLPGHSAGDDGDLEEAIRSYQAALRLQPDHYDALFFLAYRFNTDEIDRRPEAVQLYTACIALRPDVRAFVGRGSTYEKLGLLDEAIADTREAIRIQPDYASAHYNLGTFLARQGRLDEAIASFQEAIRLRPWDAKAHDNLGAALFQKGKVDEAIASFREAIRLKPDSANAHSNLGYVLTTRGHLDEAVASIREATRLDPNLPEAHQNLGIALAKRGQPQEAIASYREAIRLNPSDSDPHFELGNVLMSLGRTDEAMACYREALQIRPDFGCAHHKLGVTLFMKGEVDRALDACEEAVRLGPESHADHHLALGQVLTTLGRQDEAIARYDEAIRLAPSDAEAHNNLAWLLANRHDPGARDAPRAVTLARRAVELEPGQWAYWNTLGAALYRAGDGDAAVAALEQSMGLGDGGVAYDWLFLAMAHQQLGDEDRARSWYDKAISRMEQDQSSDEDLIRLRAEAEEQLGSASR